MEQRHTLKKSHENIRKTYLIILSISIFIGGPLAFVFKNINGFEDFSFIYTIILLGFIVFIIYKLSSVNDQQLEDVRLETLNKLKECGLSGNEVLPAHGWNKVINLNDDFLIVLERNNFYDNFNKITIPSYKILDVTINTNNSNKISVSKGGLIGGSLIGGALMGGFGAVVGAMGANKTSEEIINTLDLIITVDDLNNPIIKLRIMDSDVGIKTSSELYRNTIDLVDEWFGKFTIILKRNEK